MLSGIRHLLRGSLVLIPAALCVWTTPAAESSRGTAEPGVSRLISYAAPGNSTHFALSLKAAHLAGKVAPRDHVILVDTSASQGGDHRRQMLSVLDSFLAGLGDKDRVSLAAMDVEVHGLTTGFFAPRSAEVKAGVEKLRKRIPLGATQLLPALQTALRSGDSDRSRSIVYFGDGMSTGKLIGRPELRELVTQLRAREIPVHSFAVGPRTDLQLLGILAEHTGGVLFEDGAINDKPAQVGKNLAAAAMAPVLYPAQLDLKPRVERILPNAIPPVRTDRETVLLGEGTVGASLQVTVKGTCNGQTQSLTWTVTPAPGQTGNTFIGGLWNEAVNDNGLSVPVAGNELLNAARQNYEDNIARMVGMGQRAVASRNIKQAEQIAWAIRQVDPANVEAQTILNASRQVRNVSVRFAALVQEKEAKEAKEDSTSEDKPEADSEEGATAKKKSAATDEPTEEPADDADDDKPEMKKPAADDEPTDEDDADAKKDTPKPPAADPDLDGEEKVKKSATDEPGDDEPATEEMKEKEEAGEEMKEKDEAPEEEVKTEKKSAPKKSKNLLDDTAVQDEISSSAQDRSDLIKLEEERRRVRAQMLEREVAKVTQAAASIMQDDPDAAMNELKRTMNTVMASTDIDSNIRELLKARMRNAINDVASRISSITATRIERAQRLAQVESQKHLVEQLVRRDQKLEQLIDRTRSLLTEGFLGNANAFEEAEAVARAAWELNPYSGVTAAAIFDTEAAGQLDKAMRMRALRNDKFLATLYQVELSHVPFPDEPPILWPPAEVWKALTTRRKKWASVDLVRYNPTEERIHKALSAPTDVEFIETSLKDCLLFLKDQHNINIILEEAKIQDEGVSIDQPITLQLAGISLKSVLKLLLEPLQLTYVIENEVMKITTSVNAGEKLSTRVYPVGDLVIPIRQPTQAGGLGQGLGGVGGFSGGGAMGGGQFGMGGGTGGNGMGGGMGGGGMFSVDDELPAKQKAGGEFNNKSVQDRKKKLDSHS